MTKQADLIAYIFNGRQNQLSKLLMLWMNASPRFTVFVDTYRDKIRKKVRVTGDQESAVDLLSELEAACCLLKDRRLDVAYEPYASEKRRGADFAVTYRTNLVFNLEVTRLRPEANPARMEERIVRILFSKLGQMQPGMANLLVIRTPPEVVPSINLDGLMQGIKTLAEQRDPEFLSATGFASPADFFKDFLRLGGILLWSSSSRLWENKQARPELEDKVLRLLVALFSHPDGPD